MSVRDHLRALAEALPPGAAVSVPRDWLLELLEGSGGLQTSANSVAPERRPRDPKVPDLLLTAEQVAERLATTPAWVYANWRMRLPFGQKVSHRQLRFSARALERHLAGPPRRGGTT